LIFAAGHDHSLQLIDARVHGVSIGKRRAAPAKFVVVSGLGSNRKKTAVTHRDDTLFSHLHPGFMAADFMTDGSVYLKVFEPDEPNPVYTHRLK
jgi:hypothetical protein